MKEIKLSNGMVAIVDDDWFDYLKQWKWYARKDHNNRIYAYKKERTLLKTKSIQMHRIVARTPQEMECDHINGNSLDNRISNLRNCTSSENSCNRGKTRKNSSGYKGVTMVGRVWQAQVKINGKNIYLGTFETAEQAALAYDSGARKYHGEFAKTNF